VVVMVVLALAIVIVRLGLILYALRDHIPANSDECLWQVGAHEAGEDDVCNCSDL